MIELNVPYKKEARTSREILHEIIDKFWDVYTKFLEIGHQEYLDEHSLTNSSALSSNSE